MLNEKCFLEARKTFLSILKRWINETKVTNMDDAFRFSNSPKIILIEPKELGLTEYGKTD